VRAKGEAYRKPKREGGGTEDTCTEMRSWRPSERKSMAAPYCTEISPEKDAATEEESYSVSVEENGRVLSARIATIHQKGDVRLQKKSQYKEKEITEPPKMEAAVTSSI